MNQLGRINAWVTSLLCEGYVFGISERRPCRTLGQHRSTQRKIPQGKSDEAHLRADIFELARKYGRDGYRRIAALLRAAGWHVNDKRVERIWRQEGLKVPAKQPKRGRLWSGYRTIPLCQSSRIAGFGAAILLFPDKK